MQLHRAKEKCGTDGTNSLASKFIVEIHGGSKHRSIRLRVRLTLNEMPRPFVRAGLKSVPPIAQIASTERGTVIAIETPSN
jgi:hypothetical protein